MALIECTECKTQISDQALICPKCGKPQKGMIQLRSFWLKNKVPIALVSILLLFAAFFFLLDRGRPRIEESPMALTAKPEKITEETFYDSARYSLDPSHRVSYPFKIREKGYLTVTVTDTFGNNIEFEIRRDGKLVFESGVQQGKAEGLLNVERGKYNIVIINGNILDRKTGEFNVHVKYK